MKLLSTRRYALLSLACAALGMLLWYGLENFRQSAVRTVSSVQSGAHGKANEKGSSLVNVLSDPRSANPQSTQSGQVPLQFAGANSLGPFNDTARSLIRSGSLGKIDYGLSEASNGCLSFLQTGGDGPKALNEFGTATQRQQGGTIGLGLATEAMRLAGFQRSYERCAKLFEGARFSAEEHAAFGALPSVVQFRSVLNTLSNAQDFNNPEAMAALSLAVTEPMFGALAALLVNKIDYSDIVTAYGREQVMPLYALSIPLVLCRMGDDCGPGGIVSEQLCWLNRICGDPVEEAIWSTLRAQGVDTRAMGQFVTKVHQGLQNRDPSIFKKPK